MLLPWYAIEGARWSAPALLQGFQGRPWLLALFLPLIAALAARPWRRERGRAAAILILAGGSGILLMLLQGFLFRHPEHHAGRLADAAGHGLWRAARRASAS